jgi:hypothetical protein
MRRTFLAAVVGLGLWGSGAATARAEVTVRVPFFSITVGPRVCPGVPRLLIGLPFFDIPVRRATLAAAPAPPVAVAEPPRYDRVQPPPPEPLPVVVRPVTVAEFASSFRPAPGTYEAVLIHPMTRAPVKVRFTLPAGVPKKVRARRRELVFDYGRHWVKLRFVRDGGVRVMSR